jgi:arsenate reductase
VTHVLFVCVQNAGRSQMAEALFGLKAGGRHEGRSAGSKPAKRVHPEVVAAMREAGVDLSGRSPRALSDEDVAWADVVVTMGCGDACPVLPGKRYVDWELPDPAGKSQIEVQAIRDEIDRRVDALLADLAS